MSQFGMQMPGGRARSGPQADVFTAMAVVATVCMAAACGVLYWASMQVAPDGQPWKVQDADQGIVLPTE